MTGVVPLDDRGAALGDGLFETLLVVRGEPLGEALHVDRLARGCAVLGLPAPGRTAVRAAIVAAVWEAGLEQGRAAVRVSWSAGSGGRGLDRPAPPTPRLWASAGPAPALGGTATLVTAAVRRNEGSPVSRLKSLSYLDSVLARAQARAAGADEALMLNNAGEVACAAAANLFWREGDRLMTPDLGCGVLDGVARGRLIERAPRLGLSVETVRTPRAALDRAEAIFLTNSLIGVRPVIALDGRALRPDPLAEGLAALCSDLFEE